MRDGWIRDGWTRNRPTEDGPGVRVHDASGALGGSGANAAIAEGPIENMESQNGVPLCRAFQIIPILIIPLFIQKLIYMPTVQCCLSSTSEIAELFFFGLSCIIRLALKIC